MFYSFFTLSISSEVLFSYSFLGGNQKGIIYDMFSKERHIVPSAASFIAELRKRGLKVIKAKNDVLDGIRFMAMLLSGDSIKYNNCCQETFKEFSSYIWDAKASEKGESDVLELIEGQKAFNRLSSDDIDALKFNMFPQTVAINAAEETLKNIKISPGALIDLKQEPGLEDGNLDMKKLESQFGYGDKLEKTLSRTISEMHELLNVTRVGLEDLRGLMTSGKSMKALYWQLVTRCEEKYTAWRSALEWLTRAIIEMSKVYKLESLPELKDMKIEVENIYPLMEDESDEKALDMQAVNAQVMSRKSYLLKWNKLSIEEAEEELRQIALEKSLLEEAYVKGLDTDGNE